MKYRKLGNTDLDVSILGFGASSMGDVFGKRDPEDGKRAVGIAIDRGVNYFDVAPLYGFTLSEQRLGEALQGKRSQVIVSTKCGRDTFEEFDYSAKRVAQSIDESLRRLQTDFVDIYQIHDVEFADRAQIINETLPAARKVQQSGKARYIGITGLPVRYLRSIAEQIEIDTIMSWGHYTLVEDELDEELIPVARAKRGIGVLNAAPLMQGLLTERDLPEWHRGPKPLLDIKPKLTRLCREAGVDVACVAMKYALDYPHAASTVVSMSSPPRVETNLAALDFEIPDGLLEQIAALVAPVKNIMWYEGRPENNIPPSDPNRWVPQYPETTHS